MWGTTKSLGHVCWFSRPLHFARRCVSERGKQFRLDQNGHAAGSKAGACLAGQCGVIRKVLRDLSKRIHPITSLLRNGVKVDFMPAMEVVVSEILAELAAPPISVLSDWDVMADGSHPFHVYCDARIDGFGGQEEPDGSMRPIAYISRATLDSERHWSPLELEAGSIVWAIERLRGHLWGMEFRIFSDHKALEIIGKAEDHNAPVQR